MTRPAHENPDWQSNTAGDLRPVSAPPLGGNPPPEFPFTADDPRWGEAPRSEPDPSVAAVQPGPTATSASHAHNRRRLDVRPHRLHEAKSKWHLIARGAGILAAAATTYALVEHFTNK